MLTSPHNLKPLYPSFKASELLARNKNSIMLLMESRIRSSVRDTDLNSPYILQNYFSTFIDQLIFALNSDNPLSNATSNSNLSSLHGISGAGLPKYLLPQLLMEFSVLRQLIIENLYNEIALNLQDLNTINRSIDSAICFATTEFTGARSAFTKDALKKAETSNIELEHFASVAAHDLNSPLSTISGYAELLKEDLALEKNEDSEKHLNAIIRSTERMSSLINSLLNYARLNKTEKSFQNVDINNIIKSALLNIGDLKNAATITNDSMPVVFGDPELLVQIFQNLIANGIKFHSSNSLIMHISVEERDDAWLFSVTDNGIGFDPIHKEEIFGLYKKLHTQAQGQGSGIGLATCRKVVEMHGGRIWAESEPGKGSTFYFTLPKIKSASSDHQ